MEIKKSLVEGTPTISHANLELAPGGHPKISARNDGAKIHKFLFPSNERGNEILTGYLLKIAANIQR